MYQIKSNGASSFTLSSNIGGFTDVSITTNSNAQGGAEPETKESIRYNAPLQYSDHKTEQLLQLIMKL